MASFSVLGSGALAGSPALQALQAKVEALQALAARLQAFGESCRALEDDSPEGLLSRRTVVSDRPDGATATALPAAPIGAYRIRIFRLAHQHHIASDAVPASRSVIPAGHYVFSLGAGEHLGSVEVVVGADDWGGDVLETLSQAIDAAGIGAHAWVEYTRGERGDVARLHVLSRASGTRGALYTADVTRNLMVLIGLAASGEATAHNGGTVEPAEDAHYEVDGLERTAPGNRIYLADQRLCLALHGEADDGGLTLRIQPDAGAIGQAMGTWSRALADARAAAAQPAVHGVLAPEADFAGTVDALQPQLAACGLGADLELDGAALARALQDGEVLIVRIQDLADKLEALAERTIADIGRAISALARQAEWYKMVPDPAMARRLARHAIAAYFPGLPRASGGK